MKKRMFTLPVALIFIVLSPAFAKSFSIDANINPNSTTALQNVDGSITFDSGNVLFDTIWFENETGFQTAYVWNAYFPNSPYFSFYSTQNPSDRWINFPHKDITNFTFDLDVRSVEGNNELVKVQTMFAKEDDFSYLELARNQIIVNVTELGVGKHTISSDGTTIYMENGTEYECWRYEYFISNDTDIQTNYVNCPDGFFDGKNMNEVFVVLNNDNPDGNSTYNITFGNLTYWFDYGDVAIDELQTNWSAYEDKVIQFNGTIATNPIFLNGIYYAWVEDGGYGVELTVNDTIADISNYEVGDRYEITGYAWISSYDYNKNSRRVAVGNYFDYATDTPDSDINLVQTDYGLSEPSLVSNISSYVDENYYGLYLKSENSKLVNKTDIGGDWLAWWNDGTDYYSYVLNDAGEYSDFDIGEPVNITGFSTVYNIPELYVSSLSTRIGDGICDGGDFENSTVSWDCAEEITISDLDSNYSYYDGKFVNFTAVNLDDLALRGMRGVLTNETSDQSWIVKDNSSKTMIPVGNYWVGEDGYIYNKLLQNETVNAFEDKLIQIVGKFVVDEGYSPPDFYVSAINITEVGEPTQDWYSKDVYDGYITDFQIPASTLRFGRSKVKLDFTYIYAFIHKHSDTQYMADVEIFNEGSGFQNFYDISSEFLAFPLNITYHSISLENSDNSFIFTDIYQPDGFDERLNVSDGEVEVIFEGGIVNQTTAYGVWFVTDYDVIGDGICGNLESDTVLWRFDEACLDEEELRDTEEEGTTGYFIAPVEFNIIEIIGNFFNWLIGSIGGLFGI